MVQTIKCQSLLIKSVVLTLAISWLIEAARERSEGASMVDKLSNVMYETVEGKSAAIR